MTVSETSSVDGSTVLFQKFRVYDFDGDATFQNGLPRVLQTMLAQGLKGMDLDREVQRFKAFYFSKKVAPFNFTAYLEWERKLASASRSNEPVCPFIGAVGKMPTNHPPIAQVKAAVQLATEPKCPFAPSVYTPKAVAASASSHLQLTRSQTGLAHVRVVLSDPAQYFDPASVAVLGNHLLNCMLDRSITSFLLSLTISDNIPQSLFNCGRDPSLDLWSIAHGPIDSDAKQKALENELRLISLMHQLSSMMPTIVLVDGPVYGLGLPLMLACRFRVGSQRTELRLAGSTLIGTCLGPLLKMHPGTRRYLALATGALYIADLLAIGFASDFVPRIKHNDLETALAAAAACPAPHTDKAIKKTINDMIEAAGPTRLRTFEKIIEDSFNGDLPTILSNLQALNPTPWQQATIASLMSTTEDFRQFAVDILEAAALASSVAVAAAAQYERVTRKPLDVKVLNDRASMFETPVFEPSAQSQPRWLIASPTSQLDDEFDWRQLIASGIDNGPAVLLEQPFYAVEALLFCSDATLI